MWSVIFGTKLIGLIFIINFYIPESLWHPSTGINRISKKLSSIILNIIFLFFIALVFFFVRYYKWKQLNIFHLYTLNKIKSTRKLLNNIMKIWINFKSIRWVLAIKMYKNIKINGIQLNKLIPEASKINCSQIMIKNGRWCKKMQKCFENTFFLFYTEKMTNFFFLNINK